MVHYEIALNYNLRHYYSILVGGWAGCVLFCRLFKDDYVIVASSRLLYLVFAVIDVYCSSSLMILEILPGISVSKKDVIDSVREKAVSTKK